MRSEYAPIEIEHEDLLLTWSVDDRGYYSLHVSVWIDDSAALSFAERRGYVGDGSSVGEFSSLSGCTAQDAMGPGATDVELASYATHVGQEIMKLLRKGRPIDELVDAMRGPQAEPQRASRGLRI